MTLPPERIAEAKRILDREARRILNEYLAMGPEERRAWREAHPPLEEGEHALITIEIPDEDEEEA